MRLRPEVLALQDFALALFSKVYPDTDTLISRARITFATSTPATKGNLRWLDRFYFYFGSKTFVPPTFSASCAILVAHTLECAFLRACQR